MQSFSIVEHHPDDISSLLALSNCKPDEPVDTVWLKMVAATWMMVSSHHPAKRQEKCAIVCLHAAYPTVAMVVMA